MPQADEQVIVEVRGDDTHIPEDMQSAREKVEKESSKIGEGLKKGISAGAKIAATSIAAIGTAAVAIGGLAVSSATDIEKAVKSYASSTGTLGSDLKSTEEVLKNIYANNYGEDFQDIADAMASVQKNIDGLSDEKLQELTESAFALRDQFEYEIPESTRAAKAMMDNFGVSGEEAMNLIAAGAQNGLDYSGELIDSINEYSVQFGKLGLTADDMFNIFQKGAESGAFNLDKIGDAVKEFSIKAIDGSDSTIEGFTAIGLDADKMAKKLSEGGESAREAFQETLTAIASIKDPLKQDAAGVALFGTMWEDLGADAVTALADIEYGAYSTGKELESIKTEKYTDLGSMFEGLKRTAEMLLVPLGQQLIPFLKDIVTEILPAVEIAMPALVSAVGALLTPLLRLASDSLPGVVGWLSELFTTVGDEGSVMSALHGAVQSVLDVFTMLSGPLKDLISGVLPVLLTLIASLLPPVAEIVSKLLPPLIGVLTSLLPPIAELITSLLPPLTDVLMALIPPIELLLEGLIPPLTEVLSALSPAVEALTPLISGLALMFSDILMSSIQAILPWITTIIDTLEAVINFSEDVFTGDWDSAWSNIVRIFKNLISAFAELYKIPFNAMINGINKVFSTLGSISIPDWVPEIGGKTFQLPQIPTLHVGGILDFKGKYESPILAKDGEMVLTEAQQKRLFDIANGITPPAGVSNTNSSVVQNYYTTQEVTNNNSFSVRSDSDIERISEELASLQRRNDAAEGR